MIFVPFILNYSVLMSKLVPFLFFFIFKLGTLFLDEFIARRSHKGGADCYFTAAFSVGLKIGTREFFEYFFPKDQPGLTLPIHVVPCGLSCSPASVPESHGGQTSSHHQLSHLFFSWSRGYLF